VRSYAYCVNQPALSAAVKSVTANDMRRVSLQGRAVNAAACDDAEMVAGVLGTALGSRDTTDQVYHVKGYDVMELNGQFSLIVFLTRQITGRLSGVTSLCTVRSGKMSRDADLVDYTVFCMEHYSSEQRDESSLNARLDTIMRNYGNVVPVRALHKHWDKPVKIREVVLENTAAWFYASKSAVLSALDRMRLLAACLDHSVQVLPAEQGVLLPDNPQSSSLGMRMRTDDPNRTCYQQHGRDVMRGLTCDETVKNVTGAYDLPERLVIIDSSSKELEVFKHAVIGETSPVLLTNDVRTVSQMLMCNVVAYDAVRLGGTWSVNIFLICSEREGASMIMSSWGERRLSYMDYYSEASALKLFGGRARVTSRDAAIASLSRKYNDFVPIRDMAIGAMEPIHVRECLIFLKNFRYVSYCELNSYMSDVRVISQRS